MFILGDSDELVRYSLFKDMFDNCPSDRRKLLIEPDCKHADSRSEKTIRNIFEFMGEKIGDQDINIFDSTWEKTFHVGDKTKELLMDLTGFDFLPSKNVLPARIESVFEDSKIFGEEEICFKKKVKSLKNILDLKVDRKMISKKSK
jgi:hypothetical protein